jgi:hypothetical protein
MTKWEYVTVLERNRGAEQIFNGFDSEGNRNNQQAPQNQVRFNRVKELKVENYK